MKEQWIMTLKSVQYEVGETFESVLDTEEDYSIDRNGDRIIEYTESEATGMEGSEMQLRISPDDMVSIVRSGAFNTHLVIEQGRKHFCHYDTPFGEFAVGVAAKWIRNHLTDEGGSLKLRYTVDADSTLLTDNEIEIAVRKMSM